VGGTLYDGIAAIDTSAALALRDPNDQFYELAHDFFRQRTDLTWAVVGVTSHEAFTRCRYHTNLATALACYDDLRDGGRFRQLPFLPEDEATARASLERMNDQSISFHDALCAAVMVRNGVGQIFTFDRDFWILGLTVIPGSVR